MPTRKCIKCSRELALGDFEDNWRHKVNVCRRCKANYQRDYQRMRRQREEKKKELEINGLSKE